MDGIGPNVGHDSQQRLGLSVDLIFNKFLDVLGTYRNTGHPVLTGIKDIL